MIPYTSHTEALNLKNNTEIFFTKHEEQLYTERNQVRIPVTNRKNKQTKKTQTILFTVKFPVESDDISNGNYTINLLFN